MKLALKAAVRVSLSERQLAFNRSIAALFQMLNPQTIKQPGPGIKPEHKPEYNQNLFYKQMMMPEVISFMRKNPAALIVLNLGRHVNPRIIASRRKGCRRVQGKHIGLRCRLNRNLPELHPIAKIENERYRDPQHPQTENLL